MTVTSDGRGVASHAGTRLLADLADAAGVSAAFSDVLGGRRRRRSGHDPGRVLTDLAVMLADDGEAISDLAVLRDQAGLFGPVASTATAWRVLAAVDADTLEGLREARAQARERACLLRGEAGRDLPGSMAGGKPCDALVLDVDATLVVCHSEKEDAAAQFKGTFGYHPLLVWLDNTNEALAGMLRPGNAGANTAADHITVTDQALAQIPDAHRYGTAILIRADGAGCSRAWLAHLRGLRDGHGLDLRFSVGFTMTHTVQEAILALPESAWTPAVEADGGRHDGADVAELTGLLPDLTAAGCPAGMLRLTDHDGWRFQTFATDTPLGQLAWLEARHRAHARVEDRIRTAKDTGLGRFPSRVFAINAVWLELALTACDLIAWAQTTLLDDALAACEPKTLRYQLLHVAARLTRGQRRTWLRIAEHWPWRQQLSAAFARLAALQRPLQI